MLPAANLFSSPVASHTCTVETLLKKMLNHEDTKSQRNTKKNLAKLCALMPLWFRKKMNKEQSVEVCDATAA